MITGKQRTVFCVKHLALQGAPLSKESIVNGLENTIDCAREGSREMAQSVKYFPCLEFVSLVAIEKEGIISVITARGSQTGGSLNLIGHQ